MFLVEITSETDAVLTGRLVLADHTEQFESPLGYWSTSDYLRQWRDGLERAASGNNSCLVHETVGQGQAGHVFLYLLYPDEAANAVHVQEKLFLAEWLPDSFDPHLPYALVPERATHDEDGEQLLEWTASFDDLRAFATSNARGDGRARISKARRKRSR